MKEPEKNEWNARVERLRRLAAYCERRLDDDVNSKRITRDASPENEGRYVRLVRALATAERMEGTPCVCGLKERLIEKIRCLRSSNCETAKGTYLLSDDRIIEIIQEVAADSPGAGGASDRKENILDSEFRRQLEKIWVRDKTKAIELMEDWLMSGAGRVSDSMSDDVELGIPDADERSTTMRSVRSGAVVDKPAAPADEPCEHEYYFEHECAVLGCFPHYVLRRGDGLVFDRKIKSFGSKAEALAWIDSARKEAE